MRHTRRASPRLGSTGEECATARALLVINMRGLGTPKPRSPCPPQTQMPFPGFDPAWEPSGDFLDEPQIAVGIVEGEERPVAGALGVEGGLPRLGGACHTSLMSMPRPTSVTGRIDVGDDESALGGAWRGLHEALAERSHFDVWPSELDLMARLAGMTLRERWANWKREPFTSVSTDHVSVWEKTS